MDRQADVDACRRDGMTSEEGSEKLVTLPSRRPATLVRRTWTRVALQAAKSDRATCGLRIPVALRDSSGAPRAVSEAPRA